MLQIKSALISGLLMGFLGVAGYIVSVGDVFKLDIHALVNVLVLSILTTLVSLIKSGLTTTSGTFAGIKVK